MRKLKQSAALLLLVSFLLSMFSFSVLAANQITVNICPKLLKDQQALNNAIGRSGDPGGDPIKGATFDLYKLGDLNMAEPNKVYACETNPASVDEFPFDKGKQSQDIEINGKKYKFYGDVNVSKTATTNNNGVAAVKFGANESGWYIAIMHDAGEKTCYPTFIYVDTESNNTTQNVFPKAVDMANDNDLPGIKKYILGANETRFVSKPGKKFVNDGEDDERTIDYQIDVDIPRIKGVYKGDVSALYGKEIDQKYPIFSVTDNALENNELVEKIAGKCRGSNKQVEVTPIAGDDQVVEGGVFAPNDDYTLKIVGKTITVDFKRDGRGFSDKVKKFLWTKRGDKNARFRIRFSVKIRDLAKYFLDQKNKLQHDSSAFIFLKNLDLKEKGKVDINQLGFQDAENDFKKMLRVENTARFDVQKGNNKKTIISNKVICQFGVLCLRKMDKQGNKLKGAEFDLLSAIPDSLNPTHPNYKAKWLGRGALDPKTGDRYFVFLAGKSKVLNKNEEPNLTIPQINNMAEGYSDVRETFYLNETKAPDGYEQLKAPVAVQLGGGFNYTEVINIPKIAMPFTGGVGTILFTVVGILLIGSGAYLLINAKRKKSAE